MRCDRLAIFTLAAALGLSAASAGAADEKPSAFTVAGTIEFPLQGPIRIDLVKADDFEAKLPVQPFMLKIEVPKKEGGGRVQFEFRLVPPGRYALRAFQDLNDNSRLDLSWAGPPAEPWGYYKPVRPTLRKVRFDEVAFEVSGDMKGLIVLVED